MSGQRIDFSVAINDRVRHLPTGSVGRVIGLLAGLEGRRLAHLQYRDGRGSIQDHWALLSELERLEQPARPAPATSRFWERREPVPGDLMHVRGEWQLVEGYSLGAARIPVAVVFVSDELEVHSRVVTGCELLPAFADDADAAHWFAARASNFLNSEDRSATWPRFSTSVPKPIAAPSARELMDFLFEVHVLHPLRGMKP